MKQIKIEYYGMEGQGATVKEAKADAGRKLASLAKDVDNQAVIRVQGHTLILVRNSWSWSYHVISPDDPDGSMYSQSSGYSTREEAEKNARRHLAQNLIFVASDHGASVIRDAHDYREHIEYVAWQLAARHAKTITDDSKAIHRWACDNSRSFVEQAQAECH